MNDRLNEVIIEAMKDAIMHDQHILNAGLLNQICKDLEIQEYEVSPVDSEHISHLESRKSELMKGKTREQIYGLAYERYAMITRLLFK